MAAPYRANHQHKVKAHTSEASKMSAERASIGASLLSGCRKAIEELQKNQLQSGVGAECSAPLLLQKMFELFGGDHFFYSNNFP
ncbi:hypothetical protein [Ruminococcus bicirculans (ex Wegman et al. 2014)]|uniref:hypothetical protein n=1 Tax=Ruminococcus bicirculans (ex Wegman et al. 2014) TaxID=1160721 RepID=UPI001C025985|nr:hypothetical protein [Ruminococcus bicirculans (ex Wegman et al. 2014)]